jgi:hypothetical protein
MRHSKRAMRHRRAPQKRRGVEDGSGQDGGSSPLGGVAGTHFRVVCGSGRRRCVWLHFSSEERLSPLAQPANNRTGIHITSVCILEQRDDACLLHHRIGHAHYVTTLQQVVRPEAGPVHGVVPKHGKGLGGSERVHPCCQVGSGRAIRQERTRRT